MEKENTNIIKNPVPTDLNKRIPPYFLIAALVVLIIGIVAYLSFFKNIFPLRIIPTQSPVALEKALITIKTKAYETTSEKGVQIYLSSTTGSTDISAFQIKFILPGVINKDNVIIKINQSMEDQAWEFPIVRSEEEDGVSIIKLSGFRLGNSPYAVKGNLLLATITNKDGSPLPIILDDKNTILYSSDAITKIPFDTLSE